MPPDAYRELLAASNMKQRIRKLLEYTWADRLSYAVVGHAQPARVRPGILRQGRRRSCRREADRAASTRARSTRSRASSGLPESVATRYPTTDTFSLRRPRRSSTSATRTTRWTCWCGGTTNEVAPADLAARVGLEADDVEAAYGEIERKRVATEYLHAPAVLRRSHGLTVCGIAGIVRPRAGNRSPRRRSCRMARAIRHRGPDGYGLALDAGAGLVSTRLAIVDLPCGWQPLPRTTTATCSSTTARSTTTSSFAKSSRGAGETFATTSDTEVVLRLLEREGLDALDRFNGQFAFAWWQPARAPAHARARPLRSPPAALLRCSDDGTLVFGSEAKALFASGEVERPPRSRRHRRRLHALGRRGRRAPPSRASSSCRRAACSSGSEGGSSSSGGGGCPSTGSAAERRTADLRALWSTASGCAFAPTCPSAPTSPAASTRA